MTASEGGCRSQRRPLFAVCVLDCFHQRQVRTPHNHLAMALPKPAGSLSSLPDFGLSVSASEESALHLGRGALLLLQYVGDPIAELRLSRCAVAECTIAQVFASVLLPVDEAAIEAHASDQLLEPWERGYAAACAAFVRGEFEKSVQLCAANLRATWQDAFSARLIVLAGLLAGDVAAALDPLASAMAARAAVEGSRDGCKCAIGTLLAGLEAFALEEAGRFSEARGRAEAALEATALLNTVASTPLGSPLTAAFAVHSLCHVFESLGEPAAGIACLDALDSALWLPCSLLAPHIWWHRALFELDAASGGSGDGNVAAALATYQAHLADPPEGDPFALSDASALLLRVWALGILPGVGAVNGAAGAFVSAQLVTLHARWDAYRGRPELLRRSPFFFAHAELVRGAAATGPVASVIAGVAPVLTSSLVQLSDATAHRAAFCASISCVADAIAGAVDEGWAAAARRSFAIFLSALDAPADATERMRLPVSAFAASVAAFARPMGGSLAQRDVLVRLAVALGALGARGLPAGSPNASLSGYMDESATACLDDHLKSATVAWPRSRFHALALTALQLRHQG